MDKIINLVSKGSKNYLRQLTLKEGGESKTFRLVTKELKIQVGYLDNGQLFIIPFGGPVIMSGEILSEVGERVESIKHIPDYGYVIKFN